MVSRFTEKPTGEVTKELLKQNTIWNESVFAFCFSYMVNIVQKYITSDSFEDTPARYPSSRRSLLFRLWGSRENSIRCYIIPFIDQWKDLGIMEHSYRWTPSLHHWQCRNGGSLWAHRRHQRPPSMSTAWMMWLKSLVLMVSLCVVRVIRRKSRRQPVLTH